MVSSICEVFGCLLVDKSKGQVLGGKVWSRVSVTSDMDRKVNGQSENRDEQRLFTFLKQVNKRIRQKLNEWKNPLFGEDKTSKHLDESRRLEHRVNG